VSNSQIEDLIGGAVAGGTDRTTLDQAKLMLSGPVAARVVKQLQLQETPAALRGTVSATPVAGSNFVTITAERRSPTQAAAVANGIVRAYINFRRDTLSREAAAAISGIRDQLKKLPVRASTLAQRNDLQDTIRQIQVTHVSPPSQTRQTYVAVAPTTPFSPTPKRDALFALAISLGLAIALAFALERFDPRVKQVDEVTELYGVPLIASIPHASAAAEVHSGAAAVPDSLREPFRSLRTNLQLASLDKPIKRLIVASAISGEGKSTIVRNLALTYREWGMSVAVLEADLRRPTLGPSFGIGIQDLGLTSVLTGECTLDDALLEIHVDIASLDAYLDKVQGAPQVDRGSMGGAATTERRLVLLPSGPTPPNPQAVLAADRMRLIIHELGDRFDIVLIDTPPLLVVSDSIPLLPQSDGVVLVTRVGRTDRQAAHKAVAVARLDPSVRLLGVIANDFHVGSGYGYGFGYGREYGYARRNGHTSER
jgi:non-specific protein-tyrosine kinase